MLVRNLARGLAEIHCSGIVHDDFATEDILVNPNSFDKLLKEGRKEGRKFH